jgi:hypothetical protein
LGTSSYKSRTSTGREKVCRIRQGMLSPDEFHQDSFQKCCVKTTLMVKRATAETTQASTQAVDRNHRVRLNPMSRRPLCDILSCSNRQKKDNPMPRPGVRPPVHVGANLEPLARAQPVALAADEGRLRLGSNSSVTGMAWSRRRWRRNFWSC